jgi:hypothetical protein
MPRPPLAACAHDVLYICEKCARCTDHCCDCSPPGAVVSINSRSAAEALQRARRVREREQDIANLAAAKATKDSEKPA